MTTILECGHEPAYTFKEVEAILDRGKPANEHMVKRLVSTIVNGFAAEASEDDDDDMGMCEACNGTGLVCNRAPRKSWEQVELDAEVDTETADKILSGYYAPIDCERCSDD